LREADLNEKDKTALYRKSLQLYTQKPKKPAKLPPIKKRASPRRTNALPLQNQPLQLAAAQEPNKLTTSDRFEEIKSMSSGWTYCNSLDALPRPILKPPSKNTNASSNKINSSSYSVSLNKTSRSKLTKKLRFGEPVKQRSVLRCKSVNFCRINSSIRYFTRHIGPEQNV
jgi:hypothetical protein